MRVRIIFKIAKVKYTETPTRSSSTQLSSHVPGKRSHLLPSRHAPPTLLPGTPGPALLSWALTAPRPSLLWEIYRNPRIPFICMILYLMSFSPLDCKTPGGWGRHVSLPAVFPTPSTVWVAFKVLIIACTELSSCSLWAWEPEVLSLPVRPRLAPRAVYSTLPGSLGQKFLGPAPLLVSSLHGPLPTGLCQCFRLKLSFLLFPRVNGLL